MSSSNERDWRETESMEDAARRLIGVMDERAKRKTLSGGDLGPEQIQDPREHVPASREKAGANQSDGPLDGSRPIAATGGECSGSDHAGTEWPAALNWEPGAEGSNAGLSDRWEFGTVE